MKLFRVKYVSDALTLFTGIVFLNMSFFLAEVSALKLNQNKQMAENIAKLLAGSSSEEEKDVFGGSAEEDTITKEIYLIFNHPPYTAGGYILDLSNGMHVSDSGIPRLGNYEIYSPPPES